jgi:hypothetical protein
LVADLAAAAAANQSSKPHPVQSTQQEQLSAAE